MAMNVTERYLDLIKQSLLNTLYVECEAQLLYAICCAAVERPMPLATFQAVRNDPEWRRLIDHNKAVGGTLQLEGRRSDGRIGPDPSLRNYSEFAHTLVGRKRLDHLQWCVERLLAERIPGDLLEAGVWRGGCCILMRAVLAAHDVRDRKVWLADSFAGLPHSAEPLDRGYPMDASVLPFLAVTRAEVEQLLQRYGLLDEQVEFIVGMFADSLPDAGLPTLALVRIDADLYLSTRDALQALYPRLASGGFLIIDDYHVLPPCRAAVDEFLQQQPLPIEVQDIDQDAVYFRKPG